jgi:hypothetical protein
MHVFTYAANTSVVLTTCIASLRPMSTIISLVSAEVSPSTSMRTKDADLPIIILEGKWSIPTRPCTYLNDNLRAGIIVLTFEYFQAVIIVFKVYSVIKLFEVWVYWYKTHPPPSLSSIPSLSFLLNTDTTLRRWNFLYDKL